MAIWAGVIVALLLVLLGGGGWLVLLSRFHNGPAYQWRQAVKKLAEQWSAALLDARQRIGNISQRRAREIDAVRDRWFDQFLARIPVKDLDRYPGIGPATVDKLIEFGFTTLKDIKTRSMYIPGIGDKRLRDIRLAFEARVQTARVQFQPGECPEADYLQEEVRKTGRELGREESVLNAVLSELGNLKKGIDELRDRALQVTYRAFLAGKLSQVLPPPIMEASLPNLEQALTRARAQGEERWKQAAPASTVISWPVSAAVALPSAASLSPLVDPARDNQQFDLEVQFAFLVARCDGHLAPEEKDFIESHFTERHRADTAQLNRVRGLCAFYATAPLNVEDCLETLHALFPAEERTRMVQFASELIKVSGDVNQKETRFLERLCKDWGIEASFLARQDPARPRRLETGPATESIQEIAPDPHRTERDDRGVLEIDPDATITAELVRRNYHRLVEKFDPAKVAELGPEFVQMAQAKRDQVEEAARALLAPFAEELTLPPKEPQSQDLRHNPDLDDLFGA